MKRAWVVLCVVLAAAPLFADELDSPELAWVMAVDAAHEEVTVQTVKGKNDLKLCVSRNVADFFASRVNTLTYVRFSYGKTNGMVDFSQPRVAIGALGGEQSSVLSAFQQSPGKQATK